MNNLQTLTTERLRGLVAETELTLIGLKEELDRREGLAQVHEIANLEHHMQSAELSLKGIRDFLTFLASDMKKK